MTQAVVTHRGARRWQQGHPWIYRSDVVEEPREACVVRVSDETDRSLGTALYSPSSEIRLRMLDPGDASIDGAWWRSAVQRSVARRDGIDSTAVRLVHAEGDGLPSLVVDRYGSVMSVQLLSAGLEACRDEVIDALIEAVQPTGVILRNDVPVRAREDLARETEVVYGDVPEAIEVRTGQVRTLVDLHRGQKTGAFLDQNANRLLAGRVARGRGLDLCCYDGGFALHMSAGCESVLAVDQSADALERVRQNAAINGATRLETREANVFDLVRELEDAGRAFDTIVLDPPAFAKNRRSIDGALRGYKELNLRAMRLLGPGGHLLTFSCSYHVSRSAFEEMLVGAARDVGRRVTVIDRLGAGPDHPAVLTIPETAYLKGALLTVE